MAKDGALRCPTAEPFHRKSWRSRFRRALRFSFFFFRFLAIAVAASALRAAVPELSRAHDAMCCEGKAFKDMLPWSRPGLLARPDLHDYCRRQALPKQAV